MRKIDKLVICVLALAVGFPFWAGGQGNVVDKTFFKNSEAKWVVLDGVDGELTIDSDCSAPAQLLRDRGFYYLYSAVRRICVFGPEGWYMDPKDSGVRLHDQLQDKIGRTYRPNQLFSLPRPFEVDAGNVDSFSLKLGPKNTDGTLTEQAFYSVYCKTLDKVPAFPAIRLEYSVADEAAPVTVELKDSVKLDASKVKLGKLIIPPIQEPLCIRLVTLTSNGNSVFSKPFSEDEVFSDAQEISIDLSSAKDLKVVFLYDYLGPDYQWVRHQEQSFIIDVQDQGPKPFFNWKSFLIRALAALMILLSAFLLFGFILDRFKKTKRLPEGETVDVPALMEEIESERTGRKDAEQQIGVLNEKCEGQQKSLEEKESEIVRLRGVEVELRNDLANQSKDLSKTQQDLNDIQEALSQTQKQNEELKKDIDDQRKNLEQSFKEKSQEMEQSIISIERHSVAFRRMLVARMSQSVNNLASRVKDRKTMEKIWEAEVNTLSASFAQFSDKALQCLPDNVSAPLMESQWKEIDKNLQDFSVKWLRKRDSWVNTAVRFYAYLHNLELYRVMSEVGFRLSDVANLYHSMRVFFQDFGIRLEDPPRLFNDKLDSRYVQENMDHRISHLYPKYPKLCDDSVIVDIQSIGFTVEGEQPVSTFIALYFKPVE